ncbi:hypothetical protein, conserved [Leishmania tarentolae]|uniref:B30.2/SPRY domain-containing protein n=1 Tax=Leishmania tarentolae TaxID=5689 RepID=A0A640KJ92_LEITA|nr:hypothetical protein, conserved [Leishmania tarentolae]
MISDEGFLSALSFGDDEQRSSPFPSSIQQNAIPSPVRDSSAGLSYTEAMTPNFYSALSAYATYPSVYPSGPYISSVSPASQAVPPLSTYTPYTYGSWAAPASLLGSVEATGPSPEVEAHVKLREAERQRQILQLERELAEEQRQRLEAHLSPSSSSAAQHSASVPGGRMPSSEAASDAPPCGGSEASRSPSLQPLYDEVGEELRGFSMEALAPPSSPSPPSAHVQARRYVGRGNGRVDVSGPDAAVEKEPPEQPTVPCASPSLCLAAPTATTHIFNVDSAVPAQLNSSHSPSPCRSSPQPCTPPKEEAPPCTTGEQSTLAHTSRAETSSPSLQEAPARSEEQRTHQRPTPSPPPSEQDRLRPSPRNRNAAHCEGPHMHEDEERLYELYKKRLARIQEALRLSGSTGVLCATASIEACRAHERRFHLTTPALSRSGRPALPSSSPPLPLAGEFPLMRRAPSTGSYTDPVAPLSCGRQRQLRWDLAHSGNIIVSSDGYVCRADATDALTLIEREYEGRMEDVLQRLVIPFYAMGTLGVTRGSLTFAFRWESRTTLYRSVDRQRRGCRDSGDVARRGPALAFGFATRAFTGYGTEAPAFLYLSTGAIAQGVSTTTTCAGAARPYGAPYTPGSELAARLDLVRGELEFYVEGVSMGVAFRFCLAHSPAPLFPVAVFSAEMDLAELLYSA